VVAVVSLGTQAVVWCLVREEHRGHEARVFGTDSPDVKITLDSLGYGRSDKAATNGEYADWKSGRCRDDPGPDDRAVYGELQAREAIGDRACRRDQARGGRRTLDEVFERIKGELNKLGPILDMEVVR